MDIEITGIDATLQEIDEVIKEVESYANKAFYNAGYLWKQLAQRRAPVKTGYMKSMIDFEYKDGSLEAIGTVPVSYAIFVEWGTSKSRPHPFVRPSFEIARRNLLTELKSHPLMG